jgi:hypothetical protein
MVIAPFEVSLEVDALCEVGVPLALRVRVANRLGSMEVAHISLEIQGTTARPGAGSGNADGGGGAGGADFVVAGTTNGSVELLPERETVISYSLIALRPGRLQLPPLRYITTLFPSLSLSLSFSLSLFPSLFLSLSLSLSLLLLFLRLLHI